MDNPAICPTGQVCDPTKNQCVTPDMIPPKGTCSADTWCWRNPLPQGNGLNGLWSTDSNNVWSVGAGGTILKWNGTSPRKG